MASTSELWFRIIVVVLSLIVVVTSIINIVYYNDAAQGKCTGVSNGFATFMMWFNIILLIFAIVVFIWGLIVLLFSKEQRASIVAPLRTDQPLITPAPQPSQPPVQAVSVTTQPSGQVVTQIGQITSPSGLYQQQAASNFVGGAVEAFSE